MQHFSSIEAFHQYMQWPAPEHPLLGLISLADLTAQHITNSPAITNDFYIITLKYVVSGSMTYGRTQFDFSRGTMLFHAPHQMIEWDDLVIEKKGFMINIHEDYLKGHALADRIKTYHYFAYSVHEALHLSPKEENILQSLYATIAAEYNRPLAKVIR